MNHNILAKTIFNNSVQRSIILAKHYFSNVVYVMFTFVSDCRSWSVTWSTSDFRPVLPLYFFRIPKNVFQNSQVDLKIPKLIKNEK